MNTAYKFTAICAASILYVTTYLVGSLELVLGTTIVLAGLIVCISQLRDK